MRLGSHTRDNKYPCSDCAANPQQQQVQQPQASLQRHATLRRCIKILRTSAQEGAITGAHQSVAPSCHLLHTLAALEVCIRTRKSVQRDWKGYVYPSTPRLADDRGDPISNVRPLCLTLALLLGSLGQPLRPLARQTPEPPSPAKQGCKVPPETRRPCVSRHPSLGFQASW